MTLYTKPFLFRIRRMTLHTGSCIQKLGHENTALVNTLLKHMYATGQVNSDQQALAADHTLPSSTGRKQHPRI